MRQRYLLLLVLAASCALAVLLAFLLRSNDDTADRSVNFYIGNVQLVVPQAYLRFEHARAGGRLPEADLSVDAKSFRPGRQIAKYRPDDPEPGARNIYLTLTPPEGNLPPAERASRLYTRFLQDDSWSHPGGLVMRRFRDDSPFVNEDLYFAPPAGRLFAARCRRPPKTPDGLPNSCLAEFRFDDIDVRARFSPDLLADWERLAASIRGLVRSFRR